MISPVLPYKRERQRESSKSLLMYLPEREEVGCMSTMHHRIHTEDDLPVNHRHRQIPPNQFEEVKEHLQDLLENGAHLVQPEGLCVIDRTCLLYLSY